MAVSIPPLDADSEGIEGKFYIWTQQELRLKHFYRMISNGFPVFMGSPSHGNWEHGYNHLHLTELPEQVAKTKGIYTENFSEKYETVLKKLAEKRKEKVRPGLDDKILASWNGLLIKGLNDCYRALGDEEIRDLAVATGQFILSKMTSESQLSHSYKNGLATITGFLEDYAAVIQGYLGLYQITFDEQWIRSAQLLANYAISNFYDESEGFFHFTDSSGETLIARKKELFDNVVPASNSIMAENLYLLGMMLDREDYGMIADKMLSKMTRLLTQDVQWVTNWAALYCLKAVPTAEIAIIGSDADEMRKDLDRFFIPNKIVMGTTGTSKLPLLENRSDLNAKTAIYVCYDKTCQLPVTRVEDALAQLSGKL
jgi:uncharacterized protein YyaL (SSP411 family)